MAIAYAYFFLLLKLLYAIAQASKKTGEQKDQIHVVQSFLRRQDITKIKWLVGNSAITEVNELKNIKFKVLCYLNYF